jgi:hypothetical protein
MIWGHRENPTSFPSGTEGTESLLLFLVLCTLVSARREGGEEKKIA